MARSLNVFGALAAALVLAGAGIVRADELPLVKVWKTPTCGCCSKWVRHLEAAGFHVEVTDVDNVDPIKSANGVPPSLASCHTALVGRYVIEGHVPASDVRRLLKEKPDILALIAPGMPPGSPGMDVPGSPAFDVLSLSKGRKASIYATHGRQSATPFKITK